MLSLTPAMTRPATRPKDKYSQAKIVQKTIKNGLELCV